MWSTLNLRHSKLKAFSPFSKSPNVARNWQDFNQKERETRPFLQKFSKKCTRIRKNHGFSVRSHMVMQVTRHNLIILHILLIGCQNLF